MKEKTNQTRSGIRRSLLKPFLFALIVAIAIPAFTWIDKAIAQTMPNPPNDGNNTYWEAHYVFGPYNAYTVDLYWVTDMDNNPISGLGYYSESLGGQLIGSGYESNADMMVDNQAFLDLWNIYNLMGVNVLE